MKEVFTKENVIFRVVILFLSIRLISPIKSMNRIFGGVTNGMLLIMVLTLISQKVFLSNLKNFSKLFPTFREWQRTISKIVIIVTEFPI